MMGMLDTARLAEDRRRKNGRPSQNGQPHRKSHDGAADAPAARQPIARIDAGCQDLAAVTGESWDALHAANSPEFLFRYGGLPSRIERDDQNELLVRTINEDRMRHILARVAGWYKSKGKDNVDAM